MSEPRRRMRREARRLRRDASGPPAQPLARALAAASQRRPDAASRAWYARIEAERLRLEADPRPLSGGGGTTSTVGEVTRRASVPAWQAALLCQLARALAARRCLELGTSVGVSGAYLAAGMQLAGGGHLRSLEGHADRAEVARETWRRLDLADAEVVVGRFQHTLDDALATGPFDLAFIDGHHDGDATIEYVERIRRACRPGALLVLDDIDWSDGMRFAWSLVRARLTASLTGDLDRIGLVRLGPGDAGPA